MNRFATPGSTPHRNKSMWEHTDVEHPFPWAWREAALESRPWLTLNGSEIQGFRWPY